MTIHFHMPSQKAFCISQHGRLAMILSLMSNVSFLLIPKTLALSPRNLFHVKAMMLSRLAESAWPGWIVSRNTTITIFFCCFATIHKPSPYMDVLLPPYNALHYLLNRILKWHLNCIIIIIIIYNIIIC